MTKSTYVLIYILVMIAIIIGVDSLIFRHHFLERLIANIGIVLVFVALYLRYVHK